MRSKSRDARNVLGLVLWLSLSICSFPAQADPQAPAGLVYLSRHAPTGQAHSRNRGLSERGQQAAEALARRLSSSGVRTIISSALERSRQTAAPAAERLGLPILSIEVSGGLDAHLRATAQAIRAAGPAPTLVIGHSNTVPALIRALGGPELPDLAEDAYGELFILSPDGQLDRQRYAD